MNRRVFWGMALGIVLGLISGRAYSQGLAEYSILSGSVSAATAKAGSSLNQATKVLAGRVGQNVQKSTQPVVPRNAQRPALKTPGRANAVTPAQAASKSQLGGMQLICGPDEAKSAAGRSTCVSASNAMLPKPGTKTQANNVYPSTISLSFPK
jgi:hypothetical protein